MRILKIILAGGVLCCLLVALLHTFLLDETANFFLRHSGLGDFSIRGVSMGPHSSTVDSFSASLILPDGDRLEVTIRGVTVRYDVQQLLKNGKGQLAEIDEMLLTLKKKPGLATADLQLPDRIVFLKEELRASLPLERIRVSKLRLVGDFPAPLLKKSMTLDLGISSGELDLLLSAPLGPQMYADLQMSSPNPTHAEARITVRDTGGEILQAQVALTPESVSGTVEFGLQDLQSLLQLGEAPVVVPEMAGRVALQLDIPLNSVADKEIVLKASATDVEYLQFSCATARIDLTVTPVNGGVDLGSSSQAVFEKLHGGGLEVEALSLELAASVRRQLEGGSVRFAPQQRITVRGAKTADVEIGDLELGFEVPLEVWGEEGQWAVSDNVVLLSSLNVSRGEQSLESGPLRCGFSGISKGLTAPTLEIQSSRLVVGDATQSYALTDVHAELQRLEEQLSGQLQFAPELFGAQLQVRFNHGLLSGAGDFSVNTKDPLQFTPGLAPLSALRTPWNYPFDIETGSLSFEARGSYAADMVPKLQVKVELSEADGYFQQFLFTGLALKEELSILPGMVLEGRGSLTLDHLVGGLDSFDIRADGEFGHSAVGALPMVNVESFSASLLGGSVSSSAISYDLNAPDSSFEVNIHGVGLDQLVALVNMDDLVVTGAMSGTIPVRVHGKEITVSGGELHSEGAGGEIRYTPGMINSTGITGYALKAVEKLLYEKIQVTADYAASGQLDLLIAIQGTSPGLDTTRPVHLNINAEQNLPALLKSLRFSKGLTEELDKRVKGHYN
jgi:hypothetical protein